MICFENDFTRLEYLQEEKALYCTWIGEAYSQVFQEVMQLKLE